VLKLHEELGELTQAWVRFTGRGRRTAELPRASWRDHLSDEAADVLGHVLLFVGRQGLDLAGAIARKWRFSLPE
jgi:NTP pyrophosphatase (non-canonical NTP hydrolase)